MSFYEPTIAIDTPTSDDTYTWEALACNARINDNEYPGNKLDPESK
jgi:hypothetical protein